MWLTMYLASAHYFDTKSKNKKNSNFILKQREI